MADNVISLDSDSDEDQPNESSVAPARDKSTNEKASCEADSTTTIDVPEINTICIDDDTETTEVDTFDFEACRQTLDHYSSRATSHPKKGRGAGKTCTNSWCLKPAVKVGNEYILEYYNLPKGDYKFCQDCLDNFTVSIERTVGHLKDGTSFWDSQGLQVNDFIDLDDVDNDNTDKGPDVQKVTSASDDEMGELITNACNAVLDEMDLEFQMKKSLDETYKDMEKEFVKCAQVCDDSLKKLRRIEHEWYSDIEEFKRNFQKPTENIGEIDLPTIFIDPQTGLMANEGGQQDESSNSGTNEPVDLPPYGTMTCVRPIIGHTYYAMVANEFSEWEAYTLANITNENENRTLEVFHVEARVGASVTRRRRVACDGIAYQHPPNVRADTGRRVIATYVLNKGSIQTKLFYSGMVAELPTHLNNHRYLIFFEDGRVQYCKHQDIRLIYRQRKKTNEYFTGNLSHFILNYIKNFPRRCLLKTEIGHFVSIERAGFWVNARVETLDGNIMRVQYLNDDKFEWIYRGSPRLAPIFERLKAQSKEPGMYGAAGDIRSNQANRLTPCSNSQRKMLIPGQIVISDSSTSSGEEDTETGMSSNRAVAKKTTSRMPANFSYSSAYIRPPQRVTRTSSIIQRFPETLYPRDFYQHKCSRACVTWARYTEEKTLGIALLAIPSIFAFKRFNYATEIVYAAPCGRLLNNLKDVLKYLSDTYLPLTMDMFDFDTRTNIYDEYVVEPKHIIMQDITFGGERNPIPCINQEEDNDCPDLMTYMTERRTLDGVNINTDPGFLVCCNCEDNCRDKTKCSCWKHTVDNYRPFNQDEDRRALKKVGYEYQRLYQNVLSGVYECNSQCKCNPVTCINRVVQHGMRHKLQLFKTPKKGWGTRTVIDIPQGVFICTYVGNIMPESLANETGVVHGDEYFAELDHIEVMQQYKADYEENAASESENEENEEDEEAGTSRQSSRARRLCTLRKNKKYTETSPAKKKKEVGRQTANSRQSKEAPPEPEEDADSDEDSDTVRKLYGPNESVYVMDAKIAGNIGRYFNHSCDPNMFVQNVYIDTHDLRFPWVAFFALKYIPAGTELTWDYGYRIGSVPGKVLLCYCGAPNCRKRLL